jgi:hypothetical protein
VEIIILWIPLTLLTLVLRAGAWVVIANWLRTLLKGGPLITYRRTLTLLAPSTLGRFVSHVARGRIGLLLFVRQLNDRGLRGRGARSAVAHAGNARGADGYMMFGPATAMLYAVLGGLIRRSQK